MDNIPQRRTVALPYRSLLAYVEKRIYLPNITPSYYHVFGLIASVLFLYIQATWVKVLVLALILVADWADGATARRYNRCSRSGYLLDVVTDRASEGLIFAAGAGTVAGQVFYALWLVNLGLAYYSVRSGRHSSLPLRFVYMLVLIVQG
jgi:phosphatidylglycerophosphate synthase